MFLKNWFVSSDCVKASDSLILDDFNKHSIFRRVCFKDAGQSPKIDVKYYAAVAKSKFSMDLFTTLS